MNTQREALRLITTTDFNDYVVAKTLLMSPNTIKKYRHQVIKHNLSWSKCTLLGDQELKTLLTKSRTITSEKRMPDWTYIHKQMQMPNVTLTLLWEEYCLESPSNAYKYSAFTEHYRRFLSKVDVTMRQRHKAGEVVYVDFAGKRIPYYKSDGSIVFAEVFVGVLGASRYTFACACESQKLPDWLDAHNKMFRFLGGVPQVIVPDNLKSAVTTPGTDPALNQSYQELAIHYDTVIAPARIVRPQDKSHAEIGVQIVTRWITAALRHRKFFSLEEINSEIAARLIALNKKPFKKLPGCRTELFEQLDKPFLKPLPINIYEPTARWVSKQKVRNDYHTYIEQHYYSVPYQLVGQAVEVRCTNKTVEIFCEGRRVASHLRSNEKGGTTTVKLHQPISHQKYAEQSPEFYREWANSIGDATTEFIEHQLNRTGSFLPGLRVCASLKKQTSIYGAKRLEAACARANRIGSKTLKSVQSILKRSLDKVEQQDLVQGELPLHHNVRGADYYQEV